MMDPHTTTGPPVAFESPGTSVFEVSALTESDREVEQPAPSVSSSSSRNANRGARV
ncbi:hypothetical protein PC129_g25384 [Phytophthora cactorum]|uniref:Uncharacterized protein n=1 Tax=Phytophthora cactorum TaxID=29920 RepID=A0A8T1GPF1_9STRA|nr:hypothetical protein PC129_g25384 [Phytophthora cactorum]